MIHLKALEGSNIGHKGIVIISGEKVHVPDFFRNRNIG